MCRIPDTCLCPHIDHDDDECFDIGFAESVAIEEELGSLSTEARKAAVESSKDLIEARAEVIRLKGMIGRIFEIVKPYSVQQKPLNQGHLEKITLICEDGLGIPDGERFRPPQRTVYSLRD